LPLGTIQKLFYSILQCKSFLFTRSGILYRERKNHGNRWGKLGFEYWVSHICQSLNYLLSNHFIPFIKWLYYWGPNINEAIMIYMQEEIWYIKDYMTLTSALLLKNKLHGHMYRISQNGDTYVLFRGLKKITISQMIRRISYLEYQQRS
jgi:hypothetical protein